MFVLIGVALVFAWTCFSRDSYPSLGEALFLVLIMAAVIARTLWRQFWYIADDVSHDEQFLVVHRGAKKACIPLSEISDVYAVNAFSQEGIEISLRNAIRPFGKTIVFMPPNWRKLKGLEMDEVATEIRRRLQDATP